MGEKGYEHGGKAKVEDSGSGMGERSVSRSSAMPIRVRVNDELVVDAGTLEVVPGPDGPEQILRPSATTQFDQILGYLDEKPDPPRRPAGRVVGLEGVAAAALVLRWGSYLAVLFDHDKPQWSEVDSGEASRISNQEMARINIEASAALATWIDVFRERGDAVYQRLVSRAVAYLPMPKGGARRSVSAFGALAESTLAAKIVSLADRACLERVRAQVASHASRVLANALVNTAWRNGPVENVHAGISCGYPFDLRRVSLAEERRLMRFASEGLAFGMSVCRDLTLAPEPWVEKVLPYGLAEILGITPSQWTLTESSREVRLSAEP